MNYSKQFVRKIIYIAAITALLIPLSLVGRPSTRNIDNAIVDQGGILSRLRNDNDLSQASLSQIDPASETMKLGSLGLRGLAVNLLWMQVLDAKDKKEWDALSAALETLVKLQPNFIEVWKYQAHNLSYNVSVEFDDYEYRYLWVRNGIDFLTQGIVANRRDHRIQNELGRFTGQKFGTADERFQYRRLFRSDDLFHDRMGQFVNMSNVDTQYGKDNWLLAHEWYRLAEDMVDRGVDGREVKRRTPAAQFYQFKPAQRRNMMLSLQGEYRVEQEFAAEQWDRSLREWIDYGRRTLTSQMGLSYNLEQEGVRLQEVHRLRAALDELAPGRRPELRGQAIQRALNENVLNPYEIELLSRPLDELDDRELRQAQAAEAKLLPFTVEVERAIADQASPQDRGEAMRLSQEIVLAIHKIDSAEKDRSVWNYTHWRKRTEAESTEAAINARQAEFDASELQRKAIYMAYADINPITGERETIPGAIQEYERAFRIWSEVFKAFPELTEGTLIDDLIEECRTYSAIREQAGLLPWIANHPLQSVVDNYAFQNQEDLFTTDKVKILLQLDEMSQQQSYGLPRRPNIDFDTIE